MLRYGIKNYLLRERGDYSHTQHSHSTPQLDVNQDLEMASQKLQELLNELQQLLKR